MEETIRGRLTDSFDPEDCRRQRVCERFELPGLERITAGVLYHTVTRCIGFGDTALVKAGYGVTLRYRDEQGCEKNVTREGTALFFGLPAGFCGSDFTVYLPNPVRTDIRGSEVSVTFYAVLCLDE